MLGHPSRDSFPRENRVVLLVLVQMNTVAANASHGQLSARGSGNATLLIAWGHSSAKRNASGQWRPQRRKGQKGRRAEPALVGPALVGGGGREPSCSSGESVLHVLGQVVLERVRCLGLTIEGRHGVCTGHRVESGDRRPRPDRKRLWGRRRKAKHIRSSPVNRLANFNKIWRRCELRF